MQYVLLVYENESMLDPDPAGLRLKEELVRPAAFSKELGTKCVAAAGLKDTSSATTVRTTKGAQTLHDGPFAETKEQLGGFYLIEASDLDAALAIARRVPLTGDGAIEVRPVLEVE